MQRYQSQFYLTSSHPWYKRMEMSGIFDNDPHRSPFAGANRVYVGYCSSDAWVGDAGPESNDWGFYFKGQQIIKSLFAQLLFGFTYTTTDIVHFSNHTHEDVTTSTFYQLTSQDRVLFAGCSAGARGAMFNLDYIQAMLPPDMAPVIGFFDSPLWIDIEPNQPGIMPLQNETMAVFDLVNATARLGEECAAIYPEGEQWKCLFGEYRLPFVKTPYLMSASQFDRYQLPYNEGGMPPGKPPMYQGENLTFANEFQAAVRAVVLDLPTAEQLPRSAVFSSACFLHCTSTLAWGAFWGVKVDGISLKDYLGAWYFGGASPSSAASGAASLPAPLTNQRIESCTGFGCAPCHKQPAGFAPPLPPAYGGAHITAPSAHSHHLEVFSRRGGRAQQGAKAGGTMRGVEHAVGIALAALLGSAALVYACGRGAAGMPAVEDPVRVLRKDLRRKGSQSGVELGSWHGGPDVGEESPLLKRS